jgi:DNA replicative helicase MCM subunit Mcm2 (Cdc46/Mcm family)
LLKKNAELIDKIKEVSLMNNNTEDDDDEYGGYTPTIQPIPYIHAKIVNYAPLTKIKLIKANVYGNFQSNLRSFLSKQSFNFEDKFVCFTGTVVRVGNVKLFCRTLAFECKNCIGIFVSSLI